MFFLLHVKKVIPVSPNTFYAYLQVILHGPEGLKDRRKRHKYLESLSALSQEVDKFRQEFEILGSHIGNAKTKYDDSQKRFERFNERLSGIQDARELP